MKLDEIYLLSNKEDAKYEDELNNYLYLYYKFCHIFDTRITDYLVGNLYYDIKDDMNIVITHYIEDHVLFVNLLYDVNGKLIEPHCSGKIPVSDLLDKIQFEFLGSYFDLYENDKIALGLHKQRDILLNKVKEIDNQFKDNPSRIDFGVITFNRSVRNINEILDSCLRIGEMTKEKYIEIKKSITTDLLVLCNNNQFMSETYKKIILDDDKVLPSGVINCLRCDFGIKYTLKTKCKDIEGKKQTVYIIERCDE